MQDTGGLELSNAMIHYVLDRSSELRVLGLPGSASWSTGGAGFAVYADGRRIDGTADGVRVDNVRTEVGDGYRETVVTLQAPGNLVIEDRTIVYDDAAVIERYQVVRNAGSTSMRIDRLDTISFDLAGDQYELMHFEGPPHEEFEGERGPLQGEIVLDVTAGRSSHGRHPWFALFRPDGEVLSASVMWTGNWVFRFEPLHEGGYRVSGGLHDWEFFKDLGPGEEMDSAPIALALGADLNAATQQYSWVGRKHWYPANTLSSIVPTEWNHWWSYIDRDINEDAFKRNVEVAEEIGLEVCTLDAGWFGPSDPGTHWYDYRGDWDLVNSVRFPNGIRPISDYTHQHGMKFGLWCEIEAVGERAHLAESHPEFMALRDGERIGYVCMGSPAVREWAFNTLDRLITEYDADWIKLDFNLNPGAGCNRTDHGHGAGDGLYEHYQGYYSLLDRVRERHPEVILENCSSGGMRIDLGLSRHTHLTFLSDPDWPEHDLQVFWGTSTMLAPNIMLHWMFSEWVDGGGDRFPHQNFNPRDPDLTQHQLDYYVRISMLNVYGFSQKLPELPGWVKERFIHHTTLYKDKVRRFVREGDVFRLTEQPKREVRGDRWAGFQYSLPDRSESLLFVFRLPGGESERTLQLRALDPEQEYTLRWLGEVRSERQSGARLMNEGLHFDGLEEEDSVIIMIDRKG